MKRGYISFNPKNYLDEDDIFLTVEQVIDLLKKQPQKARVILEGCDCVGFAREVFAHEESQEIVVIGR